MLVDIAQFTGAQRSIVRAFVEELRNPNGIYRTRRLVAGNIFFSKPNWTASSWVTFYVLEYLASHVSDAPTAQMLRELIENNIPMLDLRDPRLAQLVDIIAGDLPRDMPVLADAKLQHDLTALLAELIEYAREQQAENRRSEPF